MERKYLVEFFRYWYWRTSLSWLLVFPVVEFVFQYVEATGGTLEYDRDFIPFLPAVVLAPIVEEILFRGWLTSIRGVLYPGLGFCTLSVVLLVKGDESIVTGLLTGLSLTFLTLFSVLGIVESLSEQKRPARPEVWCAGSIAAVIFGLAHLANYSSIETSAWILPGIVLSQIVGGLLYMVVRIRMGLFHCIALHALFNLEMFLMHMVVGDATSTEYIFSRNFDTVKVVFLVVLGIRVLLVAKDVWKWFLSARN